MISMYWEVRTDFLLKKIESIEINSVLFDVPNKVYVNSFRKIQQDLMASKKREPIGFEFVKMEPNIQLQMENERKKDPNFISMT